jgi:hypothetical protein
MTEAAIVDGYDVGVGLESQVAVSVWSPALGDVTCIAVDCFGQVGTKLLK